jgi:hypothetical protein
MKQRARPLRIVTRNWDHAKKMHLYQRRRVGHIYRVSLRRFINRLRADIGSLTLYFVRWKPIGWNSEPRVLYRGVFKSRADNKFGEFTTQNIEYKHYTGDRTPFHKSVKAQKSTPMLIRWQIVSFRPTQTTQSISYKPSLHTFNLIYTQVIE